MTSIIKDRTLADPPGNAAAVTPSNTVDLTTPARFLFVDVSGDVSVDLVDGGEAVILGSLAAGILHNIRVKRVRVTGTAATGIVALW